MNDQIFSVFEDKLAALPQTDSSRLQAIFGLTKREAFIAQRISLGCSPAQIAKESGTSSETVRGQLKGIYSKTYTNRQNQLAALILRAR
jgi:DNA-binding CsgD family transcriptional regulator